MKEKKQCAFPKRINVENLTFLDIYGNMSIPN